MSNSWTMKGNSSTVIEICLDDASSSVQELSENEFKGSLLEGFDFSTKFIAFIGKLYDYTVVLIKINLNYC